MKFRRVILAMGSVTLLLAAGAAQNSGQASDLPSAPSAARQPKAAPAPQAAAPAPQPQTSPTPAATQPQATTGGQPAAQGTPTQPPPDHPATPAANQPDSSQSDIAATIRRTVNEVNVVFTVTDRHGHYIRDMKKSDFQVIDDNQPADEIRSFHSETDLPLQVGLLVDASNSVRDPL